MYLNCLFHRFLNNNVGCHIGHVCTGAFGYADDIILLAPSKSALNRRLDIANDNAVSHNIIFNASKCKYLVFGDNLSQAHSIKFNNVIISASTWEKHLGNHLDASNSDRHISEATHLLYLRVNSIMHKFCSAVSDIKYFLFKSYCMSLYRCQLWNFESLCVNQSINQLSKCVISVSTDSKAHHPIRKA